MVIFIRRYCIDDDIAFIESCLSGQLEIVKWLYSLGDIDITMEEDGIFRLSYQYGHLEIDK